VTETGTIREISGNRVIIVPEKGTACFGCMNAECKTNKGIITAENPKALALEKGQIVEINAPGISILGQVLMAFIPPSLGFAAGYFGACLLFPKAGEGVYAITGVVFLFIAAFLLYFVRKRRAAKETFTVINIVPNNKVLETNSIGDTTTP